MTATTIEPGTVITDAHDVTWTTDDAPAPAGMIWATDELGYRTILLVRDLVGA